MRSAASSSAAVFTTHTTSTSLQSAACAVHASPVCAARSPSKVITASWVSSNDTGASASRADAPASIASRMSSPQVISDDACATAAPTPGRTCSILRAAAMAQLVTAAPTTPWPGSRATIDNVTGGDATQRRAGVTANSTHPHGRAPRRTGHGTRLRAARGRSALDVDRFVFGGDVDLDVALGRVLDADRTTDLVADLHHEVEVLGEEGLRVLAPLPELLALVGEPGARLLHDAEVDTGVEQRALAADALAVHDVTLRLFEWRRNFVLHHLYAGAVAGDLGAFLDRLDTTDVEAHRRVELQRASARRGLGRVVHHHPIGEVVVRALDFDVEAVHRSRRRLHGDARDRQRHQLVTHRHEDRLHREPPPIARQQLVLHRRMHERSDERVQLGRLVLREHEVRLTAPFDELRPDPPRFAQVRGQPDARGRLHRRDADLGS